MTSRFQKLLKILESEGKYSIFFFQRDVVEFLKNEENPKYRKHGIVVRGGKVWSITIGYDLRTLYFLEEENIGIREFVFFDIGDHNSVYSKRIDKKFRLIRE